MEQMFVAWDFGFAPAVFVVAELGPDGWTFTQHNQGEQHMSEMLSAFLKFAVTQAPSKGLSRCINKMWGLYLEVGETTVTEGDISELNLDSTLLKLGLAKKTGKGQNAVITYKGVK